MNWLLSENLQQIIRFWTNLKYLLKTLNLSMYRDIF